MSGCIQQLNSVIDSVQNTLSLSWCVVVELGFVTSVKRAKTFSQSPLNIFVRVRYLEESQYPLHLE